MNVSNRALVVRPLVLLTTASVIATGFALVSAADAQAAKECGRVLVPGSDWLAGQGVDVKKNVRKADGICDGRSYSNPAVQYGNGWDCYELAARLYKVKGWGQISTRGGGADNIPEGSPWHEFYPNGSGRLPVPGDLIIERYLTHGHVTVVDRVADGRVYAVEQNATDAGRKTYTLKGSALSGAYNSGIVRGFVHSVSNPFGAPGFAAKVASSKVRGLSVKRAGKKATISWSSVRSNLPLRRVQVQLGKVSSTGAVSSWKTKATLSGSSARTLRKTIGAGPAIIRVRAVSELGEGPWVKSARL